MLIMIAYWTAFFLLFFFSLPFCDKQNKKSGSGHLSCFSSWLLVSAHHSLIYLLCWSVGHDEFIALWLSYHSEYLLMSDDIPHSHKIDYSRSMLYQIEFANLNVCFVSNVCLDDTFEVFPLHPRGLN